MKRISFLLMTFAAVAMGFASCQKDETANADATLDDFAGTYDVAIAEKALTGSESYNATLTISAASADMVNAVREAALLLNQDSSSANADAVIASLLGVGEYQSNKIVKFEFTTTDETLSSKEFFPLLSSNNTFGYIKDGYIIVVSLSKSLVYINKIAYQETGSTATYNAQYNVATSIEIKITRK